MDKDTAKKIQALALKAVEDLSLILRVGDNYNEYEQIKKGVGLSIGKIQMDILEVINERFPELDHLTESN